MASRFRVLKGLFGQLNKVGDAFAAFRRKVIDGAGSVIGFKRKPDVHQLRDELREAEDNVAKAIHARRHRTVAESELRDGMGSARNQTQQLQNIIDDDLDGIVERMREGSALLDLAGYPSAKLRRNGTITLEYLAEVKQSLARNIRETGQMFSDDYAKRFDFDQNSINFYTKGITKNISKQRWQRRVKMPVSSEDLLERAKKSRGDETPSR